MSRYKPYPQYKDSGVAWIREVPQTWMFGRLKYLLKSIIAGGTPKTDNDLNWCDSGEGIPWVSIADMTKNYLISRTKKDVTLEGVKEKGLKILPEGTLLYSIFASLGKVAIAKTSLTTNQAIIGLIPNNKISNSYLYWLLVALEDYVHFTASSNTQDNLNAEKVSNFPIILSLLSEQQAIANFLDNATCKIDTLIQKQQNLIELLKEKQQALISYTVTKGLNPHVKMKDSGIEWLGEVPEHWEVKRVKFLFKIRKRIAGEEGYNVLSITQKGIKVKDIESNEGQLSMDYSKYQFANIGDFAMNHMDLLTGYVDITQFNGVISPDYRVFTLEDKSSFSKFYLYIFQNGYKNKIFYKFGQGSSQLGRWRLPTDEFNDFVFPYPSFLEQQEIANYLDNATCKIDTLISKAQKAIELLKERRTALISAAVTGKIDVRGKLL